MVHYGKDTRLAVGVVGRFLKSVERLAFLHKVQGVVLRLQEHNAAEWTTTRQDFHTNFSAEKIA